MIYPLKTLNMGEGENSLPYFYNMDIVAYDRLILGAHEIYHWLVRINKHGAYCYYTKPWTTKILFWLPPYVIKAHDEGNLKTLTLLEAETGEWFFDKYERYALPSQKLPEGKYKLYK
jgi:hypothetical protein